MIYRLRFDRFNFMAFDIWPDEIEAKLGDMFALNQPLWENFWKPLNATFSDMSDIGSAVKIPDVTCWFTDNLALNQTAYERLAPLLRSYGEFLPVNCEGVRYRVMHVTMQTSLEIIDMTASRRTIDQGYVDMHSLVFKEDIPESLLIFKTEFSGYRNIYCSGKFKTIVEDAGLQGLLFSTDLAGTEEP